ncbi:MAG: helix-turn-helix domain-containing protein [Bacteroidetes bacterium]|nr:helix-turn-helix domain-containing protein [Bacteroidota bacterium]
MERITLNLSNMVCPSCNKVIQYELERLGVEVEEIELGKVVIQKPEQVELETIEEALNEQGFPLVKDEDEVLVEKIKVTVLDLINRQAQLMHVKNSDFIAKEIGRSYRNLSDVFTRNESMTIEQYIIHQKIKRTKDFLREGTLSLSEIAAKLGYSSVQHLSGQFKGLEGITPSQYKKEVAQ